MALTLSYTENGTKIHPLIFDFDFMMKGALGGQELMDRIFWDKLAGLVLEIVDKRYREEDFDIVIYTAHGKHTEKQQQKFSYHVYFRWLNGYGVNKTAIGQIRWSKKGILTYPKSKGKTLVTTTEK